MSKSKNIYERASKIMPGGVSSPVRSLKSVGGTPLFISHAKGSKIWDIDDREYIDLCMSFGPLILGHAPDDVVRVIEQAASKGTSFGTSSLSEVKLAEKIIKFHPSTDWIRFVNSGTEAVMSAIRLARGYTARNLIVKFSGCYHGHADSMLVKAGSGLATFGISSSAGVPKDAVKDTIVISLGDIETIKNTFENFGESIAAIIIEGIPANNGLLIQTKEYMKSLVSIAHKYGALVILDEVITGFRIGLGGAAEYYEIKPDIVTFGKIIGGGLPVGAYGGRKELMQLISPLGSVYQAGTLSGNPLAMAAGNITLSVLSDRSIDRNIYSKLESLGNQFQNDLFDMYNELDVPISIRRVGSIIWIILQNSVYPINPEEIKQEAIDKYARLHRLSLKEGVYLPPSAFEVAFISTSHTSVIEDLMTKLQTVGKLL